MYCRNILKQFIYAIYNKFPYLLFTVEAYSADLPWYKKAFQWICGIEKMTDHPQLTDEEIRALEEKQNSIYEKKIWKMVLNVNAVFLMTLAVFLWGFYA